MPATAAVLQDNIALAVQGLENDALLVLVSGEEVVPEGEEAGIGICEEGGEAVVLGCGGEMPGGGESDGEGGREEWDGRKAGEGERNHDGGEERGDSGDGLPREAKREEEGICGGRERMGRKRGWLSASTLKRMSFLYLKLNVSKQYLVSRYIQIWTKK